jgi:polyketide biosynthesis acyl carrier protein
MARRPFRIVTGLTGLLVAASVNGLLNDRHDGWVGSAYAQEADSEDESAEATETDEWSAEDAGDGESMDESASTDDGSGGEEEESEPVDEAPVADDSGEPASEQDASAEPVAQEPAAPESAPETAAEASPAPSPQIASKVYDKADRVREVLYQHAREVVPGLDSHDFKGSDSLKSLGANSVDRAEILMLTLETLGLKVPLIDLAKAENLDELAGLIVSKMP